jgi:TonB family protein
MSRPDPFDRPLSSAAPVSLRGNDGSEGGERADGLSLTKLATALSAHGGEALAADLALDLVLNEIVEHARLSTGATAAAIALARGDEIVCRATTGANAPDLGVRLDVHSGLSGACVQTQKWQRCDDTESDSRVNAEICRDLGVRSILVFPVMREHELLGVFEIFSPRLNAFSDREIQTLQALSRSIVNNVDHAADVIAPPLPAASTVQPVPVPVAEVDRLHVDPLQVDPARVDAAPADHAEPDAPSAFVDSFRIATMDSEVGPRDYSMIVLTLAVIVLALSVGWMAGYVRRPRGPFATKAKAAVNAALPAQAKSPDSPAVAAPDQSATGTTPAPGASQHNGTGAPPLGGLVVYENGKVVFQAPPTQSSPSTAQDLPSQPFIVPPKVADEYVMQRVEPEYPESAREQHIQGPVVLEVSVDKDGAVEKISTISGDSQLAVAATDAVRQWRFKPFYRNGTPEEFQTQITVSFRLP